MQAAASQNKGAMSAIIFDEIPYSEVERICNLTGCEIANYNSPAQAVISGAKEAVREAEQILQTAYPQVRMVALNVSAPFHSRSMEPIEKGFSQFLQSFVGRFKMEKVTRVLSNYSGQFHSPQNLVTALVKQISGPVRWIENMRVLARSSMPIYEIGPQRVLAKFFSSIGISVQSITDLRSLDRLTRSNSPHGA